MYVIVNRKTSLITLQDTAQSQNKYWSQRSGNMKIMQNMQITLDAYV